MKNKISVIVPVYNVEDYIDKCVNSILENSYSELEIILVDDGSTDKSGIICDHFADLDSRVLVIHKKNGGLSSARNAGLDLATGDYISFIDSDDYIEKNMFKLMIENAIQNDADIVQCGITTVNENGDLSTIYRTEDWIREGKEILDDFFVNQKIHVMVCNKLFRKELVKNIRFIEGRNNEDNMFMIDILPRVNKMGSISKQMYYYLMRSNSITGTKFSEKKFDSIFAYKYMLDKISVENIKYIPYINYWRCKNSVYLWRLINDSNLNKIRKKKYYNIVDTEFEKAYPFYMSIKGNVKTSDRVLLWMFKIDKLITVKLYKLSTRMRSK